MKKLKKDSIEFRYYEIPQGTQVLALLGEKWITSYGKDPMHFHNYFEMGYCYSGNGTMYFGDASVPYKTGDVIVLYHDTNAKTSTAQALPDVIKYFMSQGFVFRTL